MESLEAAPAPQTSKARLPLLRPFGFRDFRLLFSGESVSVVGDQFHFVALAWLTLKLTGSGLALGSVLMMAAVPRAIFMLVGGALSDRLSPRSLMLYSNGVRALLVGGLAALVLSGQVQLWHLYLLAAAFGVVDALFYPAVNAILPMLVDEPTLPPANALMQGSQQLAQLIGPALAGLLVALVNTGPVFAFDAASFAFATVTLLFVLGGRRASRGAEDEQQAGLLGTIGAGFGYAWRDPAVRSLILLTAAFNFAFTGPLSVGIPFLAEHRLGGGSATFGILLSAFGAGALIGAIGSGGISRVPRLGTVVLTIAVFLGVALALIGVAPSVPVALGLVAVLGLGAGFLNVHVTSWLQGRTAPEMRGRVMSMVMLGSVSLTPISFAVAGVIVDVGAVDLMFAVAGLIIIAASLSGFVSGVPGQMTYATVEEEA